MGFSDKTPQYPAWLKFIDAISPKQGNKKDEVVNLTSPTDEEMAENNNDILLIKENKTKKIILMLKCETTKNTLNKKMKRQKK